MPASAQVQEHARLMVADTLSGPVTDRPTDPISGMGLECHRLDLSAVVLPNFIAGHPILTIVVAIVALSVIGGYPAERARSAPDSAAVEGRSSYCATIVFAGGSIADASQGQGRQHLQRREHTSRRINVIGDSCYLRNQVRPGGTGAECVTC